MLGIEGCGDLMLVDIWGGSARVLDLPDLSEFNPGSRLALTGSALYHTLMFLTCSLSEANTLKSFLATGVSNCITQPVFLKPSESCFRIAMFIILLLNTGIPCNIASRW